MIVEMVDPKGINKLHILGKRIEAIKEFSRVLETLLSLGENSLGVTR